MRDFLDVADHPNELYPTLNRIMDEAAAAVADELPASEAVRWVLTAANPRLTPDHKLHLTLLHFDVLNVPEAERKVSPVVKLSAFLSRIGGGEGLLMSAITVSSSRVLRGQGEKSPLDLAPFYSEIVAALRSEIETTQAR